MSRVQFNLPRDSDGLLYSPPYITTVLVDNTGPDYETQTDWEYSIHDRSVAVYFSDPMPINKAWKITVTYSGEVQTKYVIVGEGGYNWEDIPTVNPATLQPIPTPADQAAWVAFLSQVHLAKGDKGDPGATGPKGDTGPQGDKGDQGNSGTQGIQGLKGDTGSTGSAGVKGDTGATGLKGDKGDTGNTGTQGIQGLKGDTGSQGIQGIKGDTGSQGIQGVKGDAGSQGIQGIKGDTGATGPAGSTQRFGARFYRKQAGNGNAGDLYFGGGSNTNAQIPMDSTSFNDDATYFQLTGGYLKILKAGLYMFAATLRYGADGASGERSAYISYNGFYTPIYMASGYVNNASIVLNPSGLYRCAANDTIYLMGVSPVGTVVKNTGENFDMTLSAAFIGS